MVRAAGQCRIGVREKTERTKKRRTGSAYENITKDTNFYHVLEGRFSVSQQTNNAQIV
jgi:hypothetical protein